MKKIIAVLAVSSVSVHAKSIEPKYLMTCYQGTSVSHKEKIVDWFGRQYGFIVSRTDGTSAYITQQCNIIELGSKEMNAPRGED